MSRTLVAYFSITGVTGNVADRLAQAIGADLFEVRPVRTSSENGEGESETVTFPYKNFADYDRIFVGLPIWWYAAPTVIHTFLSEYDLSGKILIPFATSGEGGLDKVRPRLQEWCQGADLREASLLTDNMTGKQLREWASEFHK